MTNSATKTAVQNIAVTTDLSTASCAPFRAAANLAKSFGARLHVVYLAIHTPLYTAWQLAAPAHKETASTSEEVSERLTRLVTTEPAFQGLEVHPTVLTGTNTDPLTRFEALKKIDLLVLATHVHPRMHRFPIGSFASKVLRLVSCPTLIFRTSEDNEEGSTTDQSFHPRRILVPYDFSPASESALLTARQWTDHFHAEAELLFVVEEPPQLDHRGEEYQESYRKCRDWLGSEAIDQLRQLCANSWGERAATPVVRAGNPVAEILHESQKFDPDMIIMASVGISSSRRLLLGSVTERTIQESYYPILVTK